MASGRSPHSRHAGTSVFIPPGVPHNIANATDGPARVLMTVSPPGHENYFEELAQAVSRDNPPDAKAFGELRRRYDTDQLSALKASKQLTAAVLDTTTAATLRNRDCTIRSSEQVGGHSSSPRLGASERSAIDE